MKQNFLAAKRRRQDSRKMFFLAQRSRVIAHGRRGHSRLTQTAYGHDMDTYAAPAFAAVEKLGLANTIHIGHSTGGGEVARYVANGKGRASKAVLIATRNAGFFE